MRSTIFILSMVAAFWAKPASAQGLNWFYCYAPDARSGTVYVSDVQAVGPVSERALYGTEFSRYLVAKGKLVAGGQAYCVMRATEREIERGQQELAQHCTECAGANKFEHVVWPRGGNNVRRILAGTGSAGKAVQVDSAPQAAPRANTARPASGVSTTRPAPTVASTVATPDTPVEGLGVFMMGRGDETDVVFTANRENGQFLTRFKADQKGGRWNWVLLNDKCPGWLAVTYASNGNERRYFVARGAADEGAASARAMVAARSYAKREGGVWEMGVLYVFTNDYRQPGADFSGGLIEGVKQEVGKRVVDPCAATGASSGIGVRG